MNSRNLIGPQVRDLRQQNRWSQQILAAKLQIAGFNATCNTIEQIESGAIAVRDCELFYFSKAFQIPLSRLFPSVDPHDPELQDKLARLMNGKK